MAQKAQYLALGTTIALSFSTGMPVMIVIALLFLINTWFADRCALSLIYAVTAAACG